MQDSDGVWHSPALFVEVAADNAGLGGGGFVITLGSDYLEKEYFARDLVAALEGDGSEVQVWAIAGDVNLTSNEQGELAGPFIGLTIVAVLLIVGIAFRSFWAVAIAGAGLAVLMVWIQGGANLLGFKRDQLLSTILPISIISFGIDSAFHGIGRVREQRRHGDVGSRSFVVGLGAVLGALALAAVSDAAAFLSNTASGIESVVQFGFAAAIATISAFILLGVVTPLLLSHIEEKTGGRATSRLGRIAEMLLAVGAAAAATATVLVVLFVSPELGLGLLAGYLVLVLLLPYLIVRRRSTDVAPPREAHIGSQRLGASVAAVASRPLLTIGIAVLVTAAAMWAALQLEVTFDVNDFFSPDSDFVVGLDKTTQHLGRGGGEPVDVYIETDLTSPEALAAIERFVTSVDESASTYLAAGAGGAIHVDAGLLELVQDAGVTDTTSAQNLRHLYEDALAVGVGDPAGDLWWSANDVGTVLWLAEDGTQSATVVTYQIPESRNSENVAGARQVLDPLADALERELREVNAESDVVVTGSVVYRDDQLAAIRRAMLVALPIAIAACLVVAALFMRSFRYAFVSVVPILLVVTWLYGFMYVAGFSVNVVTSIIGAVSVGIGIDFSTHFTMRYVEEKRDSVDRSIALARAGTGTGAALFGSAVTSVAGFGALALAPMPMFASYGLLTAIMVALALIASLYVLPSLLAIVTRDRRRSPVAAVVARSISIGIADDVAPVTAERLLAAVDDRHPAALLESAEDIMRMVADGELDVGVVQRLPGVTVSSSSRSLVRDELVAVGAGAEGAVPIDRLGHSLVVTGQNPRTREAVAGVLASELGHSVLTHGVADPAAGIRLAERTGGVMIVPRSVADRLVGVPAASLDPAAWFDLEVLVAAERTGDPTIASLIKTWIEDLSEPWDA
jgi:predicted RND superfamily exporter protein